MPPRPPARRPEPPRREEHREPMRPGPHPVGQGFRGPEPHLMEPDFVDLDRISWLPTRIYASRSATCNVRGICNFLVSLDPPSHGVCYLHN